MSTEPFITYEDTLMFLFKEQATPLEEELIYRLIDMSTNVIVNFCGQDPRQDPEQDCLALGFVAAQLITNWFSKISNNIAGISEQTINEVSVKFTACDDLDSTSKRILQRYQSYSIV